MNKFPFSLKKKVKVKLINFLKLFSTLVVQLQHVMTNITVGRQLVERKTSKEKKLVEKYRKEKCRRKKYRREKCKRGKISKLKIMRKREIVAN